MNGIQIGENKWREIVWSGAVGVAPWIPSVRSFGGRKHEMGEDCSGQVGR